MKTVLVIDDDLGFLFWLGKTLESAGYNVVPAVSIAKAHAVLNALALVPDLVIIGLAFSEGAEYIGILRRDWPGVRVVAALEQGLTEGRRIPADADWTCRKPLGLSAESTILDPAVEEETGDSLQASRAEWLLVVRAALDGRTTSAG